MKLSYWWIRKQKYFCFSLSLKHFYFSSQGLFMQSHGIYWTHPKNMFCEIRTMMPYQDVPSIWSEVGFQLRGSTGNSNVAFTYLNQQYCFCNSNKKKGTVEHWISLYIFYELLNYTFIFLCRCSTSQKCHLVFLGDLKNSLHELSAVLLGHSMKCTLCALYAFFWIWHASVVSALHSEYFLLIYLSVFPFSIQLNLICY